MVKLSKEEFCKYINKMQLAWDGDVAVSAAARKARSDFLGSDLSYLLCEVCELLEKIMGCEYEDVTWYCINADFGRDSEYNKITISNEDEVVLDSPEKLYDYIVKGGG